jgi:hypothetical protein
MLGLHLLADLSFPLADKGDRTNYKSCLELVSILSRQFSGLK